MTQWNKTIMVSQLLKKMKNGEVLTAKEIYNLDNYLLIDFIGRWHLGTDINMNYYNQLDK